MSSLIRTSPPWLSVGDIFGIPSYERRLVRYRLAPVAVAAVFSLPFISLSTPVQAHVKPCHGTGTDSAVQTPVVIDRSAACPGTGPALAIHYPHSVDGTLLFQDKPPLDEASEHDDVRFVIGTGGTQPYITYGGQRYNLNNVHFHGHAEHKFAGQPFAPLRPTSSTSGRPGRRATWSSRSSSTPSPSRTCPSMTA